MMDGQFGMIALGAALTVLLATPAHGATLAHISEPSNMALCGLGIAGLVFGRQMAKRK